eukprot:1161572-Pelagomonas_calceolata.AAC.1
MDIIRHHQALSICGEALSKRDFGPYILTMDARHTERLRSLDMEIPDDVQRNTPHLVFPSGRPPNTQLSHPDGITALLLEGRGSTQRTSTPETETFTSLS